MTDDRSHLPILDIETVIGVLGKITIFAGLTGRQLNEIFKLLTHVKYAKDEYVFKQGEDPTEIYVVLKGKVKMVIESENGPLEMIEFGEGKLFGETSVIAVQPHSASAIASDDSDLLVLSRHALLSFFDSDKELFGMLILNIAREACRRLHNTDEVLLHYFSNKK